MKRICSISECERPVGFNRTVYCSAECAKLANARKVEAARLLVRDLPEHKARIAAASRRQYERTRTDPLAIAARRKAAAEWRRQNPEMTAAQNRAWQVANAEKVRAKIQRRRARLLGAFVEDVDPEVVWERDAGVCGICHEPIDPSLPWPHGMSKTLDHVLALANGGTHEYANIQLAHAVCNSRKNDRQT